MPEYKLEELLDGMTEANIHQEFHLGEYIADYSQLMPEEIASEDEELTELYANSCPATIAMPRDLTDRQADVALAATAKFLDINGSQLTVNREKMKARYRALVKFVESQGT